MRESAREREKKTDGEGTCGWPLVIFIGRVYRRALSVRKKKKEKNPRVAKQAGNEEVRENEGTGRASSESIR